MKEKTFCKALNKEILITKKGWNHIAKGSKTKRRNVKDIINRFELFKSAKHIIKNAKKYSVSIRKNEKHYVLKGHIDKKEKEKIFIIIKRDKKGNFVFYSVMKE